MWRRLTGPRFMDEDHRSMVNPVAGQQVKLLLVCAAIATLLIAIFIGAQIGAEHYADLVLGVIVLLTAITFLSGRLYWILAIASSFLGGTFPILRGQFTLFQILAVIGIAKFFLGDVVVKRTRLKTGPRFDVLLIVAFIAVLTWHGIHDRFGMRFLGSSIWGGRHYVNVFVGLAAFVVIQSVPMPGKLWSKLPYAILAVTSFDLLIGIITTIFPASIYKIYPFYSGVSIAGVEEIISGQSETGRIGAFGNFGFVLILIVFSTVSLRSLLHPSNLRRLVLLAIGGLSVLYSGFRSMVLNSLLATFIAGIRDLKGRVVWLVVLLAVFLAGISMINSAVVRLPRQIQRSLTFLPGEWDSAMLSDAADSNQFRKQVWTTWERQYFPEHPWVGRGFGFKGEWAQGSIHKSDLYDSVRAVETGVIHNGFFASLDSMGIVGTLFFVIWSLRLVVRTLQVPFRRDDPNGMVLRFIALYLAVSILSYWIGAQDAGTFLSHELVLAGVFLRLWSDQTVVEVSSEVTAPPSVAKLATA
jgi:O-antigen ligase